MQTNIIDGLKADNDKLVAHISKLQVDKSNYMSMKETQEEKFKIRGRKLKVMKKKLEEQAFDVQYLNKCLSEEQRL